MIVPVIGVNVRQGYCVHIKQLLDRDRQIDSWIGNVTVGRALEARKITLGAKPGISEEALACVIDNKSSVSDLTDVHGAGAF